MLTPLLRAFAQLDDPAFLGVLLRSLAWSAVCFLLLLAGSAWELQGLIAVPHWRWLGTVAASVGAALAAFWLFLPVATVIASLYLDRVAAAVERRCYPLLGPPRGAALAVQLWDGLGLGLRVLLLNLLALLLALLLPGIGVLLGWSITAWALGRGLFVAVAMRRMPRAAAQAEYRRRRWPVLAVGGVLGLAGFVPVLNLLLPVIGTAAMVHLLYQPVPHPFVNSSRVVGGGPLL